MHSAILTERLCGSSDYTATFSQCTAVDNGSASLGINFTANEGDILIAAGFSRSTGSGNGYLSSGSVTTVTKYIYQGRITSGYNTGYCLIAQVSGDGRVTLSGSSNGFKEMIAVVIGDA